MLSAKGRMILTHGFVKEAINQVHNEGSHLGRMKTLRKIKARFLRPGLTKTVNIGTIAVV